MKAIKSPKMPLLFLLITFLINVIFGFVNGYSLSQFGEIIVFDFIIFLLIILLENCGNISEKNKKEEKNKEREL